MIIQCPSCSTKFSLEASQLVGVENPRFHCSRCDHFFEQNEIAAQLAQQTSSQNVTTRSPEEKIAKETSEGPQGRSSQVHSRSEDEFNQESGFNQEAAYEESEEYEEPDSDESEADFDSEEATNSYVTDEGETYYSNDQANEVSEDDSDEVSHQDSSTQATRISRVQSSGEPSSRVSTPQAGVSSQAVPNAEQLNLLGAGNSRASGRVFGEESERLSDRAQEGSFGRPLPRSFDIEELPVVKADWPGNRADTVFEADLSSVHNSILATSPAEDDSETLAEQHQDANFGEERLQGSLFSSSRGKVPANNRPNVSPNGERDIAESSYSQRRAPRPSAFGELSGASDRQSPKESRVERTPLPAVGEPDFEFTDNELSSAVEREQGVLVENHSLSTGHMSLGSDLGTASSARSDEDVRASFQEAYRSLGETEDDEILSRTIDDFPIPGREYSEERASLPAYTRSSSLLQRRAGSFQESLSMIRPLGIFLSFPLVLSVALWWWSSHLAATPPALKELLHLEAANLPQLPPAGLEVVDLQSTVLTLDDGKKILEIRGNLLNATTKSFGRVRLEAKVFNQNNEQLGRMIVDSSSGISQARVQSLTAEALMKLQKSADSVFVRLNPNDRLPFRIVFAPAEDGANPEAIRWFSARIYSIEPLLS